MSTRTVKYPVATTTSHLGNLRVTTYHSTDVITTSPNYTIYNTGGWETATTKSRMNQFGDPRCYVFQKNFSFFLQDAEGEAYEFSGECIIVDGSGRFLHSSPNIYKAHEWLKENGR